MIKRIRKQVKRVVDTTRFGKPVFLAFEDRIVRVRSIDDALHQLENGWPDKATLEFVIAHNACTLAQRSIFEATKARKLFVAAAAAADLV